MICNTTPTQEKTKIFDVPIKNTGFGIVPKKKVEKKGPLNFKKMIEGSCPGSLPAHTVGNGHVYGNFHNYYEFHSAQSRMTLIPEGFSSFYIKDIVRKYLSIFFDCTIIPLKLY